MARINNFTNLATIVEVLGTANSLKGKRFAITGHLGRKRSEIAEIIRQAGGEFQDGVKWDTTHLITNKDWNSNSTISPSASRKLQEAKNRGTTVISEEQFYDMLLPSESVSAT